MLDEGLSGRRERILDMLTLAVRQHPGVAGVPLTPETRLLEAGVVDSAALLDVILDVEAACGLSFDPLLLDLEGGLTLGMVADAFLLDADAEAG